MKQIMKTDRLPHFSGVRFFLTSDSCDEVDQLHARNEAVLTNSETLDKHKL